LKYVKVINGVQDYPYDLQALYEKYPYVSFPEPITNHVLAEYNVYPVQSGEVEYKIGANQELISEVQQGQNGSFKEVFTVINK
tara:strand:+ start:816 stop:1064 length:249 start_codon:yes stop_codon:yes gene_type:complete